MNTPIIKISDDQNEITHESGVVTVFKKKGITSGCNKCVYNEIGCIQFSAPCGNPYRTADEFNGIFKLKP